VVGAWSVNPRHAWFRMVPNGAITPAQTTFKSHRWEGSQALLKPVSHFRILPGALMFLAAQSAFFSMRTQSRRATIPIEGQGASRHVS
jgi:hypothetical protein